MTAENLTDMTTPLLKPAWTAGIPIISCGDSGEGKADGIINVQSNRPTVDDDHWEYEGWSITNADAWDWSREKVCATVLRMRVLRPLLQIEEYLKRACLKPSKTRIRDQKLVDDLERVYSQMICPAL